ncbi:MAG TPA: periplasmic heavy metal sensor [Firmicutes bacterium]|nr:periplasmic heavy metal sensor [Bacillota bacterium]
MKKKAVWLTLTLVLILGVAQLAAAAPWGFGGKIAADPTKLAADLGLTDAQVAQLKDLQAQMQQAAQQFRQKFESILTPDQLEKAKSLRPGAKAPQFGLAADELGLTEEQVSQIQNVQREMYEATKELRSKLQDASFELGQLKWAKNADQATVDAKTKEVSDLRAQLQQVTQEYQKKFESILTAEQLQKVKSLRGFGGFGGFGGGRGPHGMGRFGAPPTDAPSSGTSSQS